MNPFEAFLMQQSGAFLLETARLTGLVLAAPIGFQHLPVRIRGLFVLLVGLVVHDPTRAVDLRESSLLLLAAGLGSELCIGLALGFVGRLTIGIVEIAADSIAPVMGLSAAQMFDPSMGGQSTVLTKLARMIALSVALGLGLHRLFVAAVCGSFRSIPAGSLVYPGAIAEDLLALTTEMLSAGLRLALPFLAILFVAQVALAFVARAAPAMQLFSIGFAVTLGVGGMLWILFAPDLIREFSSLYSWAEHALTRVLLVLEAAR